MVAVGAGGRAITLGIGEIVGAGMADGVDMMTDERDEHEAGGGVVVGFGARREERSMVMSVMDAATDSRPPGVENIGKMMELVLLSVKRGIEREEDAEENGRLPVSGVTVATGVVRGETLAVLDAC